MFRLIVPVATVAIVFGIIGGVGAQGTDMPRSLASDPSAMVTNFNSGAVSGSIKYRSVYEPSWDTVVYVVVRFAKPEPLSCFTYRDFGYSLRDSQGNELPPKDIPAREVFPLPAVSPHDCMSGAAFPREEGRAYFDLDAIYGKLKAAKYTLALRFEPKDHHDLAIAIPAISFRIEK